MIGSDFDNQQGNWYVKMKRRNGQLIFHNKIDVPDRWDEKDSVIEIFTWIDSKIFKNESSISCLQLYKLVLHFNLKNRLIAS